MTLAKRKCRNCDDSVYQADRCMDLIHCGTENYICARRSGDKKVIITAAE